MLQVHNVPTDSLRPYKNNARTHSKKQIAQIARSVKSFGFNNPILIDKEDQIIAGHGRWLAAQELGMVEVPVIRLEHMTEAEKRAFILADNRLAEKAGWDRDILKIELQNISTDLDFDTTLTGFETAEIDLILHEDITSKKKPIPDEILPDMATVPKRVKPGDMWQLGPHRLYCGDSLKPESFITLLDGEMADMVFTDPPYNVPISGHVGGNGKIQHAEFVCASGEMSSSEFVVFLETIFKLLKTYSTPGSIHYVCMDWRHVGEITAAGQVYDELQNICVWNKQLGGMGSPYRSQHEFIFVFKNGSDPHINNIELGKHGRNRTNIWDYPGVHASNSHGRELAFHPTVKPTRMVADAILDCSKNGGIILDCFGGSGSTLLAAQLTGRRACLIEYGPKYCDVILYRFQAMTGIEPVLLACGVHHA